MRAALFGIIPNNAARTFILKKPLILLTHRSLHNLIVSVSLFVNACNVLILTLLVCCGNHFVIFL